MPKAKGGRKKKILRPVVQPSLSEPEDPAPAPAPDEYQMSLLSVVHLWIWRDSPRSARSLILNILPRNRRNSVNWHLKKWRIWQSGCLYNKKLESYRKADMKKRL